MSTEGEPANGKYPGPVPLRRWLWRSYLHAAIIPLLVIELTFLGIYWVSNMLVHRENVEAISDVSREYLTDLARREAQGIGNDLAAIAQTTQVFARQTLRALESNYEPPAAEKARYARGPNGGLYTTSDNGTTASFYSNLTPIGSEQLRKVWRLSALDPVMIDIKQTHPTIASLYFNSFDSYNRIYPYFDVRSQYPADMDIPSYNFYYEADARRNPERKGVWTDAYIDPAGHGWMVSSIAPVWRGQKLEGVVGIDVTLETVIKRLEALKLRWEGYAVLLDRQGRIIALPPRGEADFGLQELTQHHYNDAIRSDTFKPDSFNIANRPETQALAKAIAAKSSGEVMLDFDGPHLASFARIPGPNWTLVMIAPEAQIYQRANSLRDRLLAVGLLMLGGLLVFYLAFFVFLFRRARGMSREVAAPLSRISQLIEKIGGGDYRQDFAGSRVEELDQLGHRLVATGKQLGDAHDRIVEQERLVSSALRRERQVNEEQRRFVRVMSHELRTPLAIIDSGAQIIDRKADTLAPADLRDRSGRMRAAVRRISELLQKMVGSFESESEAEGGEGPPLVDLGDVVREIATEMVPASQLVLKLDESREMLVDRSLVAIVVRAIMDNALRYGAAGRPVDVRLDHGADAATLSVTSEGGAIPVAELDRIGERFFRGSNATETDGVGISLFVGRALMQKLGGQIHVTSGNSSTTATVEIPFQAGEPAQDEELADTPS